MICPAPLSFDRTTEQVEGMMQQDTAFRARGGCGSTLRGSRRITRQLWLLAWSLRDPELQCRDARLIAASSRR
jgi:hypothetical protein